MSALSDLSLFLGYTEQLMRPRQMTRKWRELRVNVLESTGRAAREAALWQNIGACGGSLEDELCEEEPITIEEITRKVESLGRKPQQSGWSNGMERTSGVCKLR